MSDEPTEDNGLPAGDDETSLFAELGRMAFEGRWYWDDENQRCRACYLAYHADDCPVERLRRLKGMWEPWERKGNERTF